MPVAKNLQEGFRAGFEEDNDPGDRFLRLAKGAINALIFGLLLVGVGVPALPWGHRLALGLIVVQVCCAAAKVLSDRLAPVMLAALGISVAFHFLADLPRSAMGAGFTALVVIWGVTGERGGWGRWFALVPPALIALALAGFGHTTVFAGRAPSTGNHLGELLRLLFLLMFNSTGPLLRLEAKRAKAEKAAAVEAAASEERGRIARELHDVVSHHVTVMVLQAEGARAASSEPAALKALAQVVTTGRTALNELRRLLGVLRQPDDDAPADLEPQPSLEQLPALVDQLRSAGLDVDLDVTGEPFAVEPGVALSGYRIVQEALTNTLRHSGGQHAHVRIRYDSDALHVEVTDEGGSRRRLRGGSGNGLIGMQERAAAVGGTVDAGPAAGGGYAVRAKLPRT